MVWAGVILHRIQAVRDFGSIHKGDKGGWVGMECNLSHDGFCWVGDEAKVYGDARVYGDASIYGDARVYGNAKVYGDAMVYYYARVYGDVKVYGKALVYGEADKGEVI